MSEWGSQVSHGVLAASPASEPEVFGEGLARQGTTEALSHEALQRLCGFTAHRWPHTAGAGSLGERGPMR